jgi:hypothetical protein
MQLDFIVPGLFRESEGYRDHIHAFQEMRDAFLSSKHLGTTRRRPVEMVRFLNRYLGTYPQARQLIVPTS